MNTKRKTTLSLLGLATTLAIGAYATETIEQPDFTEGAAMSSGGGSQTQCYDFSKLTTGTRYELGDTINTQHAVIEMKRFHVDKGQPTQMADPFVEVRSSRLAQETAPELWSNQLNIRMTPNTPVKKVELKFAENVGSLLANIEVNGRKRVIHDGLAGANGKTLGRKGVGKAAIIVNYDSTSTGSGYNRGELRLHATKGKIKTWSIGGQHLFLDNVCITT